MSKRGQIYILKTEGEPFYKIGFTTRDPETERKPGVQTGNHLKLELLKTWEGTLQEEQELHRMLSPFRSRDAGEFYRITVPELIHAISFTSQELLQPPQQAVQALPCEPDEYGNVFIMSGPYEGLEGFYGKEVVSYPDIIHPAYAEDLSYSYYVGKGKYRMAEVFIPLNDITVTLPYAVLTVV